MVVVGIGGWIEGFMAGDCTLMFLFVVYVMLSDLCILGIGTYILWDYMMYWGGGPKPYIVVFYALR